MKMNTREKVLIIMLSALVILLGGYKLLVESSLKDLSELDTVLNNTISKKIQMQNDIQLAQTIDQKNSQIELELKQTAKPFLPSMESDKIQKYFQDIANQAGITYDSFIIAEKVASQVINNQTPAKDSPEYPAKDAANQIIELNEKKAGGSSSSANSGNSNNSKQDSKKNEQQNLIELTVVSFETQCSYEKLNTILNVIRGSERIIRVSSVSVSGVADTDAGLLNVTLSVECFGIKKIDSEDTLSNNALPEPSGKYNPFIR